jgi:hypothetical protein
MRFWPLLVTSINQQGAVTPRQLLPRTPTYEVVTPSDGLDTAPTVDQPFEEYVRVPWAHSVIAEIAATSLTSVLMCIWLIGELVTEGSHFG